MTDLLALATETSSLAAGSVPASGRASALTEAFRYYRAILATVEALDGLPGYPQATVGARLSEDVLTELRRMLESETGCIVDAGSQPSTSEIAGYPMRLVYVRAQFGNISITAQGTFRVAGSGVTP